MYAEIAINAAVKNTYTYHIPESLQDKLRIGHLVRVSFGTAMQQGIIVNIHDETPEYDTKPVIERLDPQPVVTHAQLETARWMSENYLAYIGQCLWLMLPPGFTGQSIKEVRPLESDKPVPSNRHQSVLDIIGKRSKIRYKQLLKEMGIKGARSKVIDDLVESGHIEIESALAKPTTRAKYVTTATLNIPPDQLPNIARHLGKSNPSADLLETLAARPDDPMEVDRLLNIAGGGSRATLNKLADDGYILIEKLGKGEPDLVYLTIPFEDVPSILIELRGGTKAYRILQSIADAGGTAETTWIRENTGASLNDLRKLAEQELIALGQEQVWRDSLEDRSFVSSIQPRLTDEQQSVWEVIEARMKSWSYSGGDMPQDTTGSSFLVHGVTGSGKTEIYLRAITLALAQGRQAMFLVPEIALSAQTIRRVAGRFPGQVAIVHGSLSYGERHDTWQRARDGEIGVIVGTRSAVFTHLPDIGVIILDEEHDHSYKHTPPLMPPFYHTREVAEKLIQHSGGVLILGSATPDIATYHRAQQGQLTYLHLPQRIMGHQQNILEQSRSTGITARYRPMTADAVTIDLPPVKVVDMRTELKSGNRSIFSNALQDALTQVLENGEQAMLYLNRRGQSTYVFCRDCGYVATCERCDMPITYHRHGEAMRCHHCNYQMPAPTVCPACQSGRIKFFGAGTQHIETELKKRFPDANFIRWDADTANKPDMHDDILSQFIKREASIMIGTQMIAKGLDLPLVTLVGVVSADLGLALPDFRAGERVFQLLTQVAGRAGRGLLGGQVILQTYMPDNYAVKFASRHDYAGFYEQEIQYRREMGYPPFRQLLRVTLHDTHPFRVQTEAEEAARRLQQQIEVFDMSGTEIIGPAPCFFSRIDGQYRWQVILRGPDPLTALRNMDVPRNWQVDIDPIDLL